MKIMARHIPTEIASMPLDVIIIGAGINGCGIARDAALRGLKVLLLDKGDVASGTTSWSTRLIHGGLRYLEYAEVGLVRESLRERERLFRIAPLLVKPLPLLIPIYAQGKRGPLMIRAGMVAYDLLSLDKSLDHHRMLTRGQTLKRAPGLNPEGLRAGALYYDAQVEYAERLAVENALSARAHGAIVLTYARVDRILLRGGVVEGVEFTDILGGQRHTARAPVVVNVAGPWVDEVLDGTDRRFDRLIGGTKGSHLVVKEFSDAPRDALYVEAHADQRPFFIIPWNEQYLIGTTDSRYQGDLDYVAADEDEIDYLLRETNLVLPTARLTRDSIAFTYSGVRPLPFVHERAEKSITRRHFVYEHAAQGKGLFSIVGGKLTTYRNLSEQTIDVLFRQLGRRSPPCTTARQPLPGAQVAGGFKAFSEHFLANSPLPAATSARLLRIYGARAAEVLKIATEDPLLAEPFSPATGAIGAEIVISFRQEMAHTLCDCLLRRTMVGIGPAVGLDADEAAAKIAQKFLGWDARRVEREVAAYRSYIERFHPRNMLLV